MPTNYEYIKNMTLDEFGDWLIEQYQFCDYDRCGDDCKKCRVYNIHKWLNEEVSYD